MKYSINRCTFLTEAAGIYAADTAKRQFIIFTCFPQFTDKRKTAQNRTVEPQIYGVPEKSKTFGDRRSDGVSEPMTF